MMIKYIFFIGLIFLSGCQEDRSVVTFSPKPSDVEGVWESLSLYQFFPYAALKMSPDGSSKVVFVTTRNTTIEATLSNFETKEESFFITLTGTEEGDEPELWEASLKRGQLCFFMSDSAPGEMLDDEVPFACFTRATDVNQYRKVAFEELGE